jgi:hypothetical protein
MWLCQRTLASTKGEKRCSSSLIPASKRNRSFQFIEAIDSPRSQVALESEASLRRWLARLPQVAGLSEHRSPRSGGTPSPERVSAGSQTSVILSAAQRSRRTSNHSTRRSRPTEPSAVPPRHPFNARPRQQNESLHAPAFPPRPIRPNLLIFSSPPSQPSPPVLTPPHAPVF